MTQRPVVTSAKQADPGPTSRGLDRLVWIAAATWGATGVQLFDKRDLASLVPFLAAGAVTGYGIIMTLRARREASRLVAEATASTRPKGPPRIVHLPTPDAETPPPIEPHPSAAPLRRALIIDDNAVSQTVSRHLLTSLGYAVETAAVPDAAIAALARGPVDLVLAKQPMDGIDGISLRQNARQLGKGEAPLFVGVMVAGSQEIRAFALESGFDEVLAQPLTPTALRAVLERDASLGVPEPSNDAELDGQMTLDPSVLAEFGYSVDDQEELDEFFDLFLSESSSKMDALVTAATRDDWAAITRVAHALKGSSGVTGAVRLSFAAARLEVAGKSGDRDPILLALNGVQQEYERVASRFANQAA